MELLLKKPFIEGEQISYFKYQFIDIDFLKTIVSLANKKGGYVFVGIDKESNSVDEFEGNTVILEDHIRQIISERIYPNIDIEKFYYFLDSRQVIIFKILQKSDKIYYIIQPDDYGFRYIRYIRHQDKNIPASMSLINEEQIINNYKLTTTCYKYEGNNLTDRCEITTPINRHYFEILNFIKKNNIKGNNRLYPIEVISELIINAIVHKNYLSGEPIEIIMTDDCIEIWNDVGCSTVTDESIRQGAYYFNNRELHQYFKDVGLAGMLGIGIRKLEKLLSSIPFYKLEFQYDKHIFSSVLQILPITLKEEPEEIIQSDNTFLEVAQTILFAQDTKKQQDKKTQINLLNFLKTEAKSTKEIMNFLNLRDRETFYNNYLNPCLENKYITLTIPEKPKSPYQKYIITSEGLNILSWKTTK